MHSCFQSDDELQLNNITFLQWVLILSAHEDCSANSVRWCFWYKLEASKPIMLMWRLFNNVIYKREFPRCYRSCFYSRSWRVIRLLFKCCMIGSQNGEWIWMGKSWIQFTSAAYNLHMSVMHGTINLCCTVYALYVYWAICHCSGHWC